MAELVKRGRSKSELARAMGTMYPTVHRWSRDIGFGPAQRERVAKALELPLDHFASFPVPPEPEPDPEGDKPLWSNEDDEDLDDEQDDDEDGDVAVTPQAIDLADTLRSVAQSLRSGSSDVKHAAVAMLAQLSQYAPMIESEPSCPHCRRTFGRLRAPAGVLLEVVCTGCNGEPPRY